MRNAEFSRQKGSDMLFPYSSKVYLYTGVENGTEFCADALGDPVEDTGTLSMCLQDKVINADEEEYRTEEDWREFVAGRFDDYPTWDEMKAYYFHMDEDFEGVSVVLIQEDISLFTCCCR